MRRERISERMRLLQELVPGCNKVIRGVYMYTDTFFGDEILIVGFVLRLLERL